MSRKKSTRYTQKSTLVVYLILRALVLLALVLSFLRRDYESVFICVLTLILFLLPLAVEKRMGLRLPSTLEIIILLFIFAAEILGELNSFYGRAPHWDTVLHTLNGFLCAAIGFALVDMFNRSEKFSFQLSPFYLALVAFCFSMTVGVVWEFFEYGCDQLLSLDMQKDTMVSLINTVDLDMTRTNQVVSLEGITDVIVVMGDGTTLPLGLGGYLDIGLHDTMKDLLVNFIGAVIFSIIGYFFVKSRGRSRFARRFIPEVLPNQDSPETNTES